MGFCQLLISAGNDTTASFIGNALVLLAEHPDQRRRLVDEPDRWPDAIEELLRMDTPTQMLSRVTRRDVTIHGVTIPAGAEVQLLWGAANHDDREFDEPDRFDIDRRPDRQVAFGRGIHFCLGAALARMEVRLALAALLARYPRWEVDRERLIGVGYFSEVYCGNWRGKMVAIKVLAPITPRKLFRREVEIWKSLQHPHVTPLLGASSATSNPPWYMVSPYCSSSQLPAPDRSVSAAY